MSHRALAGLIFALAFLSLGLPLVNPSVAFAVSGQPVWPSDIPISTAVGDQGVAILGPPGVVLVPDGIGGVVIVWDDLGAGNIFAQRVNADGQPLWSSGGVAVAPAPWFQFSPRAVSDGNGGVIIAWVDGRNDWCSPPLFAECDIFAQRLNVSGQPQWQNGGVMISAAAGNQGTSGIAIATDGAGGAIIAWEDARPPQCCRIFAQRVNAGGEAVWAADGIPISPEPTWVVGPIGAPPLIASDGNGGAIIAWLNVQVDPVNDHPTIAVQRVNADGQALWASGGISAGLPSHTRFAVTPDGAGGALLAFTITGQDLLHDISAQRVGGNGQLLWGASGIAIAIAPMSQVNPDIVSDGSGGAIIVWQDERNVDLFEGGGCFVRFGNCDIYAQRVSGSGQVQWQANGLPISTAPRNQRSPRLVGDGSGGAIIAWQDCRAYPPASQDFNLQNSCLFGMDPFAQRVSESGQLLWPTDGIPVSMAIGNQGVDYGSDLTSSFAIATDGAGGAILAWPDGRNGLCASTTFSTDCDVYAQRVSDQPAAPPYLALTLSNQTLSPWPTNFLQGETLVLTAGVIPGASPQAVDAYVAIRLPDGSLLFLRGDGILTREVQPILTNWTVAPYIGEIFRYTFGGGEPGGDYAWLAAFTQPGTLNFVTAIAQAPFIFSP